MMFGKRFAVTFLTFMVIKIMNIIVLEKGSANILKLEVLYAQ